MDGGRAALNKFATIGFCLLLCIGLCGCGFSTVLDSAPSERGQPYPVSFKPELLAFFRSYLKDPVAVRGAELADPALRPVAGQPRYVACLKFNARETDGSYRGGRERAVLFIDGRLDRVIEESSDLCAGAAYAPFPDLEKMTR